MNELTSTELLLEIRSLTKLSETALAEHLECSQPTVNRILNGKSECKARTLLAIQKWHRELQADVQQEEGI